MMSGRCDQPWKNSSILSKLKNHGPPAGIVLPIPGAVSIARTLAIDNVGTIRQEEAMPRVRPACVEIRHGVMAIIQGVPVTLDSKESEP